MNGEGWHRCVGGQVRKVTVVEEREKMTRVTRAKRQARTVRIYGVVWENPLPLAHLTLPRGSYYKLLHEVMQKPRKWARIVLFQGEVHNYIRNAAKGAMYRLSKGQASRQPMGDWDFTIAPTQKILKEDTPWGVYARYRGQGNGDHVLRESERALDTIAIHH